VTDPAEGIFDVKGPTFTPAEEATAVAKLELPFTARTAYVCPEVTVVSETVALEAFDAIVTLLGPVDTSAVK
jgi:hypothetical protein